MYYFPSAGYLTTIAVSTLFGVEDMLLENLHYITMSADKNVFVRLY
jgi:hypothetical protein